MLRSLVKQISSSEIHSLNTDDLLLVEAPGPGYAILPLHSVFTFTPGATAYDSVSELYYAYDVPADQDLVVALTTARLNTNTPWIWFMSDIINAWSRATPTMPWDGLKAKYLNLPLVLSSYASSGITQGDGTLILNLFYVVAAYT